MKLCGKKIGFLGDSITFGVGTSNSENHYKGFRFPDLVSARTGAVAYNYGISGTRIAAQTVLLPFESESNHFSLRVDSMEDDLDAVVVFGGTNDYGHGDAPLGDFSSREETTFYGALHLLIVKLLSKYPKATLVFLTPFHRIDEGAGERFGVQKEPLKRYVDAIKEVCEYYSIPVLDLYATGGIQPEIDVIRELYMPDGLHPSNLGAKRLADRLSVMLENLMC